MMTIDDAETESHWRKWLAQDSERQRQPPRDLPDVDAHVALYGRIAIFLVETTIACDLAMDFDCLALGQTEEDVDRVALAFETEFARRVMARLEGQDLPGDVVSRSSIAVEPRLVPLLGRRTSIAAALDRLRVAGKRALLYRRVRSEVERAGAGENMQFASKN